MTKANKHNDESKAAQARTGPKIRSAGGYLKPPTKSLRDAMKSAALGVILQDVLEQEMIEDSERGRNERQHMRSWILGEGKDWFQEATKGRFDHEFSEGE